MRTILSTMALLLVHAGWCQLDLYKTEADYVNRQAKSYGDAEFKKWKGDENTVLVFSRKGADDLAVECSDIWGFGYKQVLFRICKDSKYFVKRSGVQVNIPMVVLYLDVVAYYENGLGVLDAMKQGRQRVILKGMCATISKDLDSDMAMVPCDAQKWTDEQILLLVEAYPELQYLANDLNALKKNQGRFTAGSFSDGQMKVYVRDLIEHRKKKEN